MSLTPEFRQPPEPFDEFEERFVCLNCGYDADQDCVVWTRRGPVIAVCRACDYENEYDLDDDE